MSPRPMKRVVTGHDRDGRAIISMSGVPATVVEIAAIPGTVFYELWNTSQCPAPLDNRADVTVKPLSLKPAAHGSVVRIVDIPPDTPEFLEKGAAQMHSAFTQIGAAAASTVRPDSVHPLMHRTESIDYGIVLEGQITLILDDSETVLDAGDVVIQRGTNHAWANRSGKTARLAFILLDGRYDPGIQAAIAAREAE